MGRLTSSMKPFQWKWADKKWHKGSKERYIVRKPPWLTVIYLSKNLLLMREGLFNFQRGLQREYTFSLAGKWAYKRREVGGVDLEPAVLRYVETPTTMKTKPSTTYKWAKWRFWAGIQNQKYLAGFDLPTWDELMNNAENRELGDIVSCCLDTSPYSQN